MTTKKKTAKKKVTRKRRAPVAETAKAMAAYDEEQKANNKDAAVNIKSVIETIEAMGYDPVKKLVEARNGTGLNEFQKVAIDKELMKYVHPQKKAVDMQVNGEMVINFDPLEEQL